MVLRFKLCVFFVILSFAKNLNAQTQQFLDKEYYVVDSLLSEYISDYDAAILDSILPLYHKAKTDTAKLNLLRVITKECFGDNLWPPYNIYIGDKTNELMLKETNEGLKKEYKKIYGGTLGNKGYIEVNKGNYDIAIGYYRESMKIAREVKDTSGISVGLNNLASIYNSQGKLNTAMEYYNRSLELAQIKNDMKMTAYILNNIGILYGSLGNTKKQLEYYEQSLHQREKIGDKIGLSLSLFNLSSTYGNQGNSEKQLEYLLRSLKLAQEIGDKRIQTYSLNSIGEVYESKDSLLLAMKFYREALNIALVFENKELIPSIFNNVGGMYEKRNQIDTALWYYNQSLELAEKVGNKTSIISSLNTLANLYIKQGDVSKASSYATRACNMSEELGFPNQIRSSSNLLYKIKEHQSDYKEALRLYKLSIQMRDSVQNEDNKKATYKQQMKYEYEKKEEDLKAEEEKRRLEAEQEQKVRDTIIYAVSGGLGLSIIFLFFLYSRFQVIRKQKHMIEEQSENLHKAYNELHELQKFKDGMTGMIVHDLKNPLNAMLGYAEEVQSVNLKTRIRNTSRMMLNYVLNMLDVQKFESQQVPLQQHQQPFAEVLHQSIEQVAFLAQEKNITITNKIKRNYIVNLDEELIGRVIVNLLTNAIKYSPLKSTITIDAGATNDKQLKVMIADQGQGIPEDMLDKVFDKYTQVEAKKSGKIKSTGLGLTFCKLVVEGHAGKIWVESEEGKGSEFYLTIPLISDAGELLSSTTNGASNSGELTKEEQTSIAPIKEALSKLSIMDSIEIMEVIEKARESSSLAINTWANEVENACLNMDEETYQQLLA